MSEQSLSGIKLSQRAVRYLQSQRRKRTRRLLDKAYQEFLNNLNNARTESVSFSNNSNDNNDNDNEPYGHLPPHCSTSSSEDDRPRPPSPVNSTTSSIEFIEEISSSPSRFYYDYGHHKNLDSLISSMWAAMGRQNKPPSCGHWRQGGVA